MSLRSAVTGAVLAAAPGATVLAAQTTAFPPRPLTAATVAAADAGTSVQALDAVFLNPARTAGASGLAATYVTHEETGLRGYGLTAGFKILAPLALSLWKYEAADLFDDQLLAADPALASLGVFTTGLDVAAAVSIGRLALGAGTSAEFQHNLSLDQQRFASRVGLVFEERLGMLGLSWTGAAARSPVSGLGSGVGRATLLARVLRTPVSAHLGVEATWTPAEDRVGVSTNMVVGPTPLKIIMGWRWDDRQPTVGMTLQVERFSLAFGREFGGRTVLGGLTVLTFSMGW